MADPESPPDEHTDLHQVGEMEEAGEYPCLQQVSQPGRGTRYPLYPGKNIVGRGEDADVSLEDSSVSREHAELDVRAGGAIVRDLGSRNGTFVEGERTGGDTPITHNQRFRVGSYDFQYLTHAEALADEAAVPLQSDPEAEESPASAEAPADLTTGAGEDYPEPPGAPPEEEAAGPLATIPEPGLPVASEAPAVPGRLAFLTRVPRRVWIMVGSLLVAGFIAYAAYRGLASWLGYEAPVPPVATPETPTEPTEPRVLPEAPELTAPQYLPVFLDITAEPVAATIYFGEEKIATTPHRMTAHLEYGKVYEVRALFELTELKETLEERLRFSLGLDQQVVPLNFKAPIGTFKINRIPSDLDLYLEGSFAHDPHRAEPIRFNEVVFNKPYYLPHGRYHLELRQSRRLAGSQTYVSETIYSRDFELDVGHESYSLTVAPEELKSFPALLETTPEGADCYVNGEKIGMTPLRTDLPIGEHVVVLRKEGYFEETQPIRVEQNTPFHLAVDLKTSEAGRRINEARVRIRQKRYAESINLLIEAFQQNPSAQEIAESHYLIGQANLYQAHYDDANDHFLQAMKHELFRYAARLGLAQIYYNRGERIRALQVLIEVLIQAERPDTRSEAGKLFQQISPFKSVLYIATVPAGATVTVNGRDVAQKSPLILHDLMVGVYRLGLSLPGYQTENLKVDLGVSEFRPLVVTLKPISDSY